MTDPFLQVIAFLMAFGMVVTSLVGWVGLIGYLIIGKLVPLVLSWLTPPTPRQNVTLRQNQ